MSSVWARPGVARASTARTASTFARMGTSFAYRFTERNAPADRTCASGLLDEVPPQRPDDDAQPRHADEPACGVLAEHARDDVFLGKPAVEVEPVPVLHG